MTIFPPIINRMEAVKVTAITIAITILYQLLSALPSFALTDSQFHFYFPWFVAISQILFMLTPTIILAWKSQPDLFDILRLDNSPGIRQYVLGFMGILAIFFFSAGWSIIQESIIPEQFLQEYKEISKAIEDSYLAILGGEDLPAYLKALLIGALIPAVCEETLYRGYLQRNLEHYISPVAAIVISGVLFGIIHFNPIGIIPLITIGLFLALSAYFSKSIALPIMLHFLNNAIVITAAFQSGGLSPESNPTQPDLPVGIAIVAVISGLTLIAASAYGIFKYSIITEKENSLYE